MVKSAGGECHVMEAETWALATMIRLFVLMINWLGDLWIEAAALKVGATTMEIFRVSPFRIKIQVLPITGCV
jgi:hypothetical protein